MAEKLAVLVALAALACSKAPRPAPAPPETAAPAPAPKPIALARETLIRESGALVLARVDGSLRALVADEDDAALVEVDLEANALVRSTPLGSRPRDLLLLGDGRVAATLPDADAVIVLARDAEGAFHEVARKATPAEPLAMALDPKDETLYVSTGSSHALVALATSSLEERERRSLGREPRAVLVSSDGGRVFVSHAAETFVSVVPAVGRGGEIETRDIGNRDACAGGGRCNGARVARNAQAIARVGDRGVVVPAAQALPRPPVGVTKAALCPPSPRDSDDPFAPIAFGKKPVGYGIRNGEVGPPIFTDLPTLDGSDGSRADVGLPAMNAAPCLLPRAAVAVGTDVLVACHGSASLVRYRAEPGFDFGAPKPKPSEAFPWHNGFSVTASTKSIAVPAGPTGLAMDRDGAHAFVWSTFARALVRVEVASGEVGSKVELARRAPREEAWLRGRELFFTTGDKRISIDGRACGSCHVDGRDDGLAWETPVGVRRTRMLAGIGAQGPFGWTGEHATFEQHVRTTIKNLGGTGLPDEDLAKLASFVTKIPAPRGASSSDAEAKRGKEVFATAECGGCHASGAGDRMVHDVGTGGAFLTPTLAGVATRATLMHDGRYATLDDLIAGSRSMGRGSELSAEDRRALVKYLETL
jgi:mono/diheme cytochrome c family protein